MAEEAGKTVVGVHIASGTLYIGTIGCPDELKLDDDAMRMAPTQHLDDAPALRQFVDRIRGELGRLRPTVVGVVHPRLRAGWKYADAYSRVASEAAVMVAAAEEDVKFRSVPPERSTRAGAFSMLSTTARGSRWQKLASSRQLHS